MPIVPDDLMFKLTIRDATGGDQVAQPDPNASLGRFVSTTVIVDALLHNLFDPVTGDENAASATEYRAFMVHNSHPSLPLLAPTVWLSAEVAGGAVVAISVDARDASPVDAVAPQMTEITSPSASPSGQVFSSPTTRNTGLPLSDLPAGFVKGIWVRRTAAGTGPMEADGCTISVAGDTDP